MKQYLTSRNAFFASVAVLVATGAALGLMLPRHPLQVVRPQSSLTPQYLTAAEHNDLRAAMFTHSQAIADLRAANKGLAAELNARIDPLEAALKSMQITTGSIPSKGKR